MSLPTRHGKHRAPRRPAARLAGLAAAAGLALTLAACGGNDADALEEVAAEAAADADVPEAIEELSDAFGDIDVTPEEAQEAYEKWLDGDPHAFDLDTDTDTDTDTEDAGVDAGPLGTQVEGAPVAVGDCSNDASLYIGTSEVTAVDCDTEHNVEVIDVVSIASMGPDLPYFEAVSAEVESDCEAAFEDYVGVPPGESELIWRDQQPSFETWAEGDRNVLCLVFELNGNTTGSLKGAER